MVDIDNTKQADRKETTKMGRRTNHSIARKPKYREQRREGSVYIQIKLLSNSAAKDIQFGFIERSQEKKDIIVPFDHRPCFLILYPLHVM